MNNSRVILFLVLTLLFGCDNSTHFNSRKKTLQTEASKINTNGDTLKSSSDKVKPIFGYRFIIIGDFNGDGKQEKLIEHYYSQLDNQETNKFYENLTEYDNLVERTIKKQPFSFVISDNKLIDTLNVSSHEQQFGLSYLKNEGDLNGDGTDEISYVVNSADWSNCNTWHIMTLKNNTWRKLYSFSIWDWQLPDLPGTFNQYGLMGLENKIIDSKNDTINQELEKALNNFQGLVKKIKTNKIEIVFSNKEAELDTMIVDLKTVKRDN